MDTTLGTLLDGSAQRDAIHIAVAPAAAAHILFPGQHVGLVNGVAATCEKPIGIVDPFLQESVKVGQRFYICLYQKTVTGMRHHWSHPSFQDEAPAQIQQPASTPAIKTITEADKADAEKILQAWCYRYDQNLSALIRDYQTGDFFVVEGYEGATEDCADALKSALAIYTGIENSEFHFSCSC